MTAKTYANLKSAKAAARRAGCTNPVVAEVDGRYNWAEPKPAAPLGKPASAKQVKGLKIEKNREERNGVKRPSAGGACAAVWDWLDKNGNAMPADLKPVAEAKGWNINNASIELYQWRKFTGVGRPAKG